MVYCDMGGFERLRGTEGREGVGSREAGEVLLLVICFVTINIVSFGDRSTDDLLDYLSDKWSSSCKFGETFALALDISDVSDKVRYRSLIFIFTLYCVYTLCILLSDFLFGCSVVTVVDSYHSIPIAFTIVLPRSVLSPTLCFSSVIF